eukprot:TRINITY_DN3540_c0_g1_i3.p1 TRINITY_DN3540_c0_g1~~TRINITY_DN3540_c0_g1_i3.p1  ORF type:complete len:203 (+),score=62.63 TRINITY_DN3540_c0_g1_i3:61-669(+)
MLRSLVGSEMCIRDRFKGYSPQEWQRDKETLNTPFPNLPYLKKGDVVVAESEAVMIHAALLANRPDLLGRNAKEKIVVATSRGVCIDVQEELFKLFFNPNWEAEQPKTIEKITPKLVGLEKLVGTKKFILGENPLLSDFLLYQILLFLSRMQQAPLAPYPNLQNYFRNFDNLPEIQAYHQTDAYRNLSFFGQAPYRLSLIHI